MPAETVVQNRIVLFSDWHLPPQRTAQTEFFLRFVRDVCDGATQVFVLGDLFGAWVGPKHAARPGHAAVLDELGRLAATGTKVTLLRGNRDFLLDQNTTRAFGLHLASGGWAGELDGRTVRLSHGDELGQDDSLHKTMRAITGNFPISTLVKALPISASDRLAEFYRWLSDARHARRTRKKLRPASRRIAAQFSAGADIVVIGHWHQPCLHANAFGMAGKTFVILGECTGHEASYAEISGGTIELKRFFPPLETLQNHLE